VSKYKSLIYKHDSTKAEDLAKLFAALAHPQRIRILRNIARRGTIGVHSPKKGSGCTITQAGLGLHIGLPTLSHHIKLLKNAGLIRIEVHGQTRKCWITNEGAGQIMKFLMSLGPS
jgi:DNA-binding transcriptional ArsR family regulator